MIYFLIVAAILGLYAMAELQHYRKGHDVYDWTRKLDKRLDKK